VSWLHVKNAKIFAKLSISHVTTS